MTDIASPAPVTSVSRRVIAAVVDWLVYYAFFAAYAYSFGEMNDEGGYRVDGCLHVLVLIAVWFAMFPVAEILWGRTLGKKLLGLRVRTVGGATPPPFDAVLKRAFAGLGEIGLCFGLLAFIVIVSTPKRQRLGDLWAGTMVTADADW